MGGLWSRFKKPVINIFEENGHPVSLCSDIQRVNSSSNTKENCIPQRTLLCSPKCNEFSYWKNKVPDNDVNWFYSSLTDGNGWWYNPLSLSLESVYQKGQNVAEVDGFKFNFLEWSQIGYSGRGKRRGLLRLTKE